MPCYLPKPVLCSLFCQQKKIVDVVIFVGEGGLALRGPLENSAYGHNAQKCRFQLLISKIVASNAPRPFLGRDYSTCLQILPPDPSQCEIFGFASTA